MWQRVIFALASFAIICAKEVENTWPYEGVVQVDTVKVLAATGMESTEKLWLLLYGNKDEDQILSAMNDIALEYPYAVNAGWISKDVATFFGVQSLPPPVLMQLRAKPTWNPYKERMYRPPEHVAIQLNKMDTRALKKFVRENAPSNVVSTWNTTWLEPRVVLFTKKKTPTLLYKALSIEYPNVAFHLVHDDKELQAQFGVSELPALIAGTSSTSFQLFPAEKDLTNYNDLLEFVEPFAPQVQKGKSRWMSPEEFENALADATSAQKPEAWVILVQSSVDTPIDPLTDELWLESISDIRSKAGILINTALVLCPSDSDNEICKESHIAYLPYSNTPKTIKSIKVIPSIADVSNIVLQSLPDTTSALYGSTDINAFFSRMLTANTISFVLFTQKSEPPVLFQALALAFPKVQIGVLYHPTEEIKAQFGIRHVPSMVAVMSPLDPSVPREQFSMAFYDKKQMGPANYENLSRFLTQVVATYMPKEEPESDNVAIVLTEATSAKDFDRVCHGTLICVIGFFKKEDDEKYIPILEDLTLKSQQQKSPVVYLYIEGDCQVALAHQLGIESWHLPTIAVYSPHKHRYATHVGVMDKESIESFVHSVLYGKTKTIAIDQPFEWIDPSQCHLSSTQPEEIIIDEDLDDMADMMQEILAEEAKQKEQLKQALKEEEKERKQKAKEAKEAAKHQKTKKKKKSK
ncbi:hypothetical protein THRCLA_09891, partial [Thraustotheca clavata]